MRIAYLFTSFPKISERFLQRELSGLDQFSDLEIDIHSMFGGSGDRFGRFPLKHFEAKDWIQLPFRFCTELLRNPAAFLEMAALNDANPPRCWINCLEHYLGLGFAIVRAGQFRRSPPDQFHAECATAPASAALFLSRLTGIPFSIGCHAYDLFRRGGDVLLEEKLSEACFIHTSTEQARSVIERRSGLTGKTKLIRRSSVLPNDNPTAGLSAVTEQRPLRILSVGRLIEKKGYASLLKILCYFKQAGLHFEARILGGGPLGRDLQRAIERGGLQNEVHLLGETSFDIVEAHYRDWADVFFFTGTVAASGDRDGLPNVIVEAMSYGLPVLARPVGGVAEAIIPEKTGILLDSGEPGFWWTALQRTLQDANYAATLRDNARAWVHHHCDPERNAQKLEALFLNSSNPI
jgi:glycosyltransferase involved in cell wall biosynthesis